MTTMETLLCAARNAQEAGRSVVLTAVVRSEGSTPRSTGALMVSDETGLLAGTIGGGPLEHHCLQIAAEFSDRVGRREQFVLNNTQAGSLGMVCGGSTEVLYTPLCDTAPLLQALALVERGKAGWLCLPLDGAAPMIVEQEALPPYPAVVKGKKTEFLSIPLLDAGRIFLLGGGHVAVETAALLSRLEFRHIVVDDRREFAAPERFPDAEQMLELPFSKLFDTLTGTLQPTEQDGVCIMTRGHEGDAEALRFALSTKAGYIGLMGSRRKREAVFARLESEGFSNVAQRVVTPIGLAIGAETPAEIAVSIAAQLIEWRAAQRRKE